MRAYTNHVLMLLESNAIENEHSINALIGALEAWNHLAEQPVLTEELVLTTHRLLMNASDLANPLEHKWQGVYRRIGVFIAGRRGLDWELIPNAMDMWLAAMNKKEPNSEGWARDLHIEYERIHPFADGNGRTGRMFYNWHRLRLGMPVEIIRLAERQDYYKWFQHL